MNEDTRASGTVIDKRPLLVQLLFHPKSLPSRELAKGIHRELNDNAIVPGLRIPTMFFPLNPGDAPPLEHRLNLAERTFVVALADDQLAIDERWCRFVADTWEACQTPTARCIPFQLTKNAWPLDNRLRKVNFARGFLQPTAEALKAFVFRRVVVELCRYLTNLDSLGDTTDAPVKVFLSHSKLDIDVEPKVVQLFVNCLKADQPIEAWFDSGDIPTGSRFAKAIEEGVKHTSLLAVLTDNYASREWCREEVLLAKEFQRPIVVVNALKEREVRSFPYLGNVPTIRWNGDPQTGIDVLLKETLRHLHVRELLNRAKNANDVIFERPPELVTVAGLKSGAQVLYPDPPVGNGELRRLAKTNITFTTPLQRMAEDQSLKGKIIALSMSESTDIFRFGLDPIHLEESMVDLSGYLLIKGAMLAYGGFLGPANYTQKLFELVSSHNNLEGVEPYQRIVNHRGWPLPRLSVEQKAEVRQTSSVIELPRPMDVNESLNPDFKENPEFFSAKSAEHRFAWARGMTEMRTFQSDRQRSGVMARIVLGGTFGPTEKAALDGTKEMRWYSGRIPGVLEEVLLSVEAGQPVFLIGAFGGAARLVIDLIMGKDRKEATWEYQKEAPFAVEMRNLYESRGLPWLDYAAITDLLRHKGVAGINTLLTTEEHLVLFETADPARMVEIVLRGLGRYRG